MLEEILKKESVGEEDIKILVANMHLLSQKDKVRFGFEQPVEVENTPEVPEKKVRAPRKKA